MKYFIAAIAVLMPVISAVSANAEETITRSGIYGQCAVIYSPPMYDLAKYFISDCQVIVKDTRSGREVKRVRTNRYGHYTIPLAPGKYIVTALTPQNGNIRAVTDKGHINVITVWPGYYTGASAVISGGW